MLELQNTFTDWFQNFTPNVYIAGEDRIEGGGMDVSKMPFISFSYATSEYATNTLLTFDILTYSVSWIQALAIEERLAKALPTGSGVTFDIRSAGTFEYLDPRTGLWTEFVLEDAGRIAQELADKGYSPILDVEEIPGKPLGGIWLQRGTPFTQNATDPDFMVKRRTGNIIVRSFTIY